MRPGENSQTLKFLSMDVVSNLEDLVTVSEVPFRALEKDAIRSKHPEAWSFTTLHSLVNRDLTCGVDREIPGRCKVVLIFALYAV